MPAGGSTVARRISALMPSVGGPTRRAPAGSGLYVRRGNEVDDMEAFACPCCGIPMEYPRHAALPRAEALALICRFFATGVPPEIEGTVALAGGEIARDARWVEQDGI